MLFLITGLIFLINFEVKATDITQNFNIQTIVNALNEHKQANKSSVLKIDHEIEPHSIFNTPQLALEKLQIYDNPNVSTECVQHFIEFASGLVDGKGWAWTMLDAYGKIGSGISQGNVIWPGSFSLCNGIIQGPPYRNLTDPFHGQFCWITAATEQQFMVGQNVNLRTAVCVPNSCGVEDLNILLAAINAIPKLNGSVVLSSGCISPSRDIWNDRRAVICLVFCFFIGILIVIGTLYDVYLHPFTLNSPNFKKIPKAVLNTRNKLSQEIDTQAEVEIHPSPIDADNNSLIIDDNEKKLACTSICGKIFLCFSFYTNGSNLFNTEPRENSLMCINGIRVISMLWIILGHSYSLGAIFADNILVPLNWMSSFSYLLIAQAAFSVDTFFVLSGLLVTYLYLKEHQRRNGKISWLKFYFHRYWRLTPVYAVVLFLFYNILSPYYIDSPFWSDQGLNGDKCDKYWWVNLLYVNNFMDFNDLCMGHTWYLANDMQFYVISPLILIFITRYLPVSAIIAGCFILANWVVTGAIATYYHIGNSSNDTFDKIYEKPYCRIAPYIIGMICGYLLHRCKCEAKLHKVVVAVGWLMAFGLSSAVIFGTYHSVMTQDVESLYLALSRSAWSVALAWAIFACCNGYGGVVNSILSWPFWQPFGRLTYCTYLIHLAIIPLFTLGQEVPPHFSHLQMFSIFFTSTACSYFAAIFISLSFEAPFIALEKLFL